MTYSITHWRGFYYIKGEEGDPPPSEIGPYRYETEARDALERVNKEKEPVK